MKKIIALVSVALFGSLAFAASVAKYGMYAGTQVSATEVREFLSPSEGQIVLASLNYQHKSSATSATATATFEFFRPDIASEVYSAANTSTNWVLTTDSSTVGTIDGYTLTASDYLVVYDSSTNATGWKLHDIAAVLAHQTNGQLRVQLAATGSAAAGDKAYIVKSANIISRTLPLASAEETPAIVNDLRYQASSFDRMPIVVELTAMTNATFSGVYEVWK